MNKYKAKNKKRGGKDRCLYRILLLVALISLLPFPVLSPAHGKAIWKDVDRIVVVGDVHGDYDQFVSLLRSAKLINHKNRWTGGDTHLVQLGDVPDRGPDTLKIIQFLQKLEIQARRTKGYVHLLIGNHEAMNVYGDLYYVHPGEFEAFARPQSKDLRDFFYKNTVEAIKTNLPEDEWPTFNEEFKLTWEKEHPLGFIEHRWEWEPDGSIGEWVCEHDAVLKIDDSLFMHGGIGPKFADWSIEKLNAQIQAELKDKQLKKKILAVDEHGPLWYRGLALNSESEESAHLENLLKTHRVNRIVIAHTTTDGTVIPRFNGSVILIDVGLSKVYGGRQACLLIEGDEVFTLHRGKKLPLPTDSGAGLLNYLRQAAALDPHPSPLLKRIAELELKLTEQSQDSVSHLDISLEFDAATYPGH